MGGLDRAQRARVLLGYDASEDNEPALAWAAEEARLRGLELVICHCWHWPYPAGYVDRDVESIVRRAGETLLKDAGEKARGLGAAGPVTVRLRPKPVADALVAESEEAELIVVGSHERHRLPVGSTALQLPVRAHRPVVVVRRDGRVGRVGHVRGGVPGRVVAGVDGSPGGHAALGFAVEEAVLRGWEVRVVYGVWEPGAVDESELPLFGDKERLVRVRTAVLERAVAPWRERYPEAHVRVAAVLDRPREALLEAAEDADLIVVGDRGTGSLAPLLLGSTSSAMLQHAPCTVAVVPSSAP
ncbi:universal stress protein [Actinomadura logoneensis]|uniref:Universal stress protein n=1 Tax=Actinomadura logoneensis TaxID=2293572 RepID=A0A372JA92_9ACTN|nr:universal stress protein [Actinomadura logoneensis]RFU36734.1 universal stress protein [Actinomadura logoneensis]